MFTGIVSQRGTVKTRETRSGAVRFGIESSFAPYVLGESIAVNGVCLTVESMEGSTFFAVAAQETLSVTTTGRLSVGQKVHLERALRVGDPLGGHILSGHVDGLATLLRRETVGEAVRLTWGAPKELLRFIAPKGSVALDGVSLTVNGVSDPTFDVMVVPHTSTVTHLGELGLSSEVNLEIDVLARYVVRALGAASTDSHFHDTLRTAGFLK